MRQEYAYKALNKDLTCRGYQFTVGEWAEEEEANCVKNGFHCAKNPLDCLRYYRWDNSVVYIVQIDGDIDEDEVDSKVSCTRMKLVKQLAKEQFILQAIGYMINHPMAENSSIVRNEKGETGSDPFVFVRGKHPKARGKLGSHIVLLEEYPDKKDIRTAGEYEIDGTQYLPDVYYDVLGATC